ncbi:DNA-binding response regulator [Zhouia sp. PK063]|uniref:DNA-binding response regulator n=1 Tax=Zhouia sp. PK063 TaxID=3373602 RepID=UPI0037888E94
MKTPYHILIIDDHPLLASSYTLALKQVLTPGTSYTIHTTTDMTSAIALLKEAFTYHLIILDIQLPPLPEQKLYSGSDLAPFIKLHQPEALLLIITTYQDSYTLFQLLQQLSPDGLLTKNDVTPSLLQKAFIQVCKAPPYYSSTVNKAIKNFLSYSHIIDILDRDILYYLSIGYTIKQISKKLNISKTTILNRKNRLKSELHTINDQDYELIAKAKEKGII